MSVANGRYTMLGREAARASTAAEHDEQLEHGLTVVDCEHCGAAVRVKKHSPSHTSIQWTAAAVRTCPRLTGQAAELGTSALIGGCERLQDSIDRAGRQGRLAIRGYDADG